MVYFLGWFILYTAFKGCIVLDIGVVDFSRMATDIDICRFHGMDRSLHERPNGGTFYCDHSCLVNVIVCL